MLKKLRFLAVFALLAGTLTLWVSPAYSAPGPELAITFTTGATTWNDYGAFSQVFELFDRTTGTVLPYNTSTTTWSGINSNTRYRFKDATLGWSTYVPANVIGSGLFFYSPVKTITLPDSWGNMTEAVGMFGNATSLESVVLPSNWGNITDVSQMFYGARSLQTIDLPNDWGNITNTSAMLYGTTSLTEIDLPTSWDNITNTSGMFWSAISLESIDIPSSWGNITDTSNMFRATKALQSITLPTSWGSVTNASYMFYGSSSMTSITLPASWGNITDTNHMFAITSALSTINYYGYTYNQSEPYNKNALPPSWGNLVNGFSMFGSTAIDSIVLPDTWPTGDFDFRFLFAGTANLKHITMPKINPADTTDLGNAFGGTGFRLNVQGIDVPPKSIKSFANHLFPKSAWNDHISVPVKFCPDITTGWDNGSYYESATDSAICRQTLEFNSNSAQTILNLIPDTFDHCVSGTLVYQTSASADPNSANWGSITVENCNFTGYDITFQGTWSPTTKFSNVFELYDPATGNALSSATSSTTKYRFKDGMNKWNGVTDASSMFAGAANLKSVTLPDFGTATTTYRMFYFTPALTSVTMAGTWGNVTNVSEMFAGARSVTSVDLPDTWGSVQIAGSMFYDAENLTSIELPASWASINSVENMFNGASRLSRISYVGAPNPNINSLPPVWGNNMTYTDAMFFETASLTSIDLPDTWGNISEILDMFAFSGLTSITLPEHWGNITDIGGLYGSFAHSTDLAFITLPLQWSANMTKTNAFQNTGFLSKANGPLVDLDGDGLSEAVQSPEVTVFPQQVWDEDIGLDDLTSQCPDATTGWARNTIDGACEQTLNVNLANYNYIPNEYKYCMAGTIKQTSTTGETWDVTDASNCTFDEYVISFAGSWTPTAKFNTVFELYNTSSDTALSSASSSTNRYRFKYGLRKWNGTTDASQMFINASNLRSITLAPWDTTVTNASRMFENTGLTSAIIPDLWSNINNTQRMFYSSNNLIHITLPEDTGSNWSKISTANRSLMFDATGFLYRAPGVSVAGRPNSVASPANYIFPDESWGPDLPLPCPAASTGWTRNTSNGACEQTLNATSANYNYIPNGYQYCMGGTIKQTTTNGTTWDQTDASNCTWIKYDISFDGPWTPTTVFNNYFELVDNNNVKTTMAGTSTDHYRFKYGHRGWNNGVNASNMFLGATNLSAITLPANWGTIGNVSGFFSGTTNLYDVNYYGNVDYTYNYLPPTWGSIYNASSMFQTSGIEQLFLPTDWSNMQNVSQMFFGAQNLQNVSIPSAGPTAGKLPEYWNGISSVQRMFADTPSLRAVDLPFEWNYLITDLTEMFALSGVREIDLPYEWRYVTNAGGMFWYARNLNFIGLPIAFQNDYGQNINTISTNTIISSGYAGGSAEMFELTGFRCTDFGNQVWSNAYESPAAGVFPEQILASGHMPEYTIRQNLGFLSLSTNCTAALCPTNTSGWTNTSSNGYCGQILAINTTNASLVPSQYKYCSSGTVVQESSNGTTWDSTFVQNCNYESLEIDFTAGTTTWTPYSSSAFANIFELYDTTTKSPLTYNSSTRTYFGIDENTKYRFKNGLTKWGTASNANNMFRASSTLTKIEMPATWGSSMTQISYIFAGTSNLSEITLPTSWNNISVVQAAFADGAAISDIDTYASTSSSREPNHLPSSWEKIWNASWMFSGANKLQTAVLPSSWANTVSTSFNPSGFLNGTTSLTSVTLPDSWNDTSDLGSFLRGTTSLKSVTLPAAWASTNTNLGYMFYGSGIERLVLPDSWASVRTTTSMFQNATDFKHITLPKDTGSNWTSVTSKTNMFTNTGFLYRGPGVDVPPNSVASPADYVFPDESWGPDLPLPCPATSTGWVATPHDGICEQTLTVNLANYNYIPAGYQYCMGGTITQTSSDSANWDTTDASNCTFTEYDITFNGDWIPSPDFDSIFEFYNQTTDVAVSSATSATTKYRFKYGLKGWNGSTNAAKNMFSSATTLTSITLPASWGTITDADNMFRGATSLTSIKLPNNWGNVTNIFSFLSETNLSSFGTYASASATQSANNLPSTWGNIQNAKGLFQDALSLTSVVLPASWGNSLTDVSAMFANATALTSLSYVGNTGGNSLPTSWGVVSIAESLLAGTSSLTNITIPTTWGSVTRAGALFGHSWLAPSGITSVTLPATWGNVTNIEMMFSNTPDLTSITYHGNPNPSANALPTSWGNNIVALTNMFSNTGLQKIVLPDGWDNVTNTGYMFYDAANLNYITVPKQAHWGDITYKTNMFENTGFVYKAIGDNVGTKSIRSKLTEDYPIEAWDLGIGLDDLLSRCPSTTTGWTASVIPGSCEQTLEIISENSAYIPSEYTHCESGLLTQTSTDGINWVYSNVNCNYESLEIDFTAGTTSWTTYNATFGNTFELYNSSTGVALPKSGNTYSGIDGDTKYRFKNGFTKWGAVSYFTDAFRNSSTLTKVELPNEWGDNILQVANLFNTTPNLKEVTLPTSWNNITHTNSMFYATGLEYINTYSSLTAPRVPNHFPNVWGSCHNISWMFAASTQLKTVTFPNSWASTRIIHPGGMFSGCTALTSLSIPDSWENTGPNLDSIFRNTPSLKNVIWPSTWADANTNVSNMFNGAGVEKIILPDSWGNITNASGMFQNAATLKHVTIPKKEHWTRVTNTTAMFTGTDFDYKFTGIDVPQQSIASPADHIFPIEGYDTDIGLDLPDLCPTTTDGWTDNSTIEGCQQTLQINITNYASVPNEYRYCKTGTITQSAPAGSQSWGASTVTGCTYDEHNISFNGNWTPTSTFNNVFEFFNSTTDASVANATSATTKYRFKDGLKEWNGITSAAGMFSNATTLTSITLPTSWGTIDNTSQMFSSATSLTSVTMPASWGNIIDVSGMFSDASAITRISYHGNPTPSVNSVPTSWDNVQNVMSMFGGTSSLTNIKIPTSWGSVDQAAGMFGSIFAFSGLTSITLPANWGNITDVSYMFALNQNLTSITYHGNPSTNTNALPTSWGNITNTTAMFAYNTSLQSIKIPASWTNVTDTSGMFGASGLSGIGLPTSWGNVDTVTGMFYDVANISSIILPSTWGDVTDATDMFANATSLNNISLPNVWTNNSGATVTTTNTDEGTSIFTNTGFTCYSDATINGTAATVAAAGEFPNPPYKMGIGLDSLPSCGPVCPANTTGWTDESTDEACRQTLDINLTNHANIPEEFRYCKTGTITQTANDGDASWGAATVTGCTFDELNIEFTSGTSTWEPFNRGLNEQNFYDIFELYDASTNTPLPLTNDVYSGINANTKYRFKDGLKEWNGITSIRALFNYAYDLKSITLPSSWGPVTNISLLFGQNSSLTSVTLPTNWDNVTDASDLFNGATSLPTVTLPNNWGSITTVHSMFSGATSLTSINLPTNWGSITDAQTMFNNASSLPSVNLPTNWGNITNLHGMFMDATSLTSINLPSTWGSVTTVTNMFYNASSLPSVTLPNSWGPVTNVVAMFGDTSSLTSVNLPSNWGSITDLTGMFGGASSLANITLPSSWGNVTNTMGIFWGASSLNNVTLPATWGDITSAYGMFQDATSLNNITLPAVWTNDSGANVETLVPPDAGIEMDIFGNTGFTCHSDATINGTSASSAAAGEFPNPPYKTGLGLDSLGTCAVACPANTTGWTDESTNDVCKQTLDINLTNHANIPSQFRYCKTGTITQTANDGDASWSAPTITGCTFDELNIEFTSGTTVWAQPVTGYNNAVISTKFADVFELYNKSTGTALAFDASTNTYSDVNVGGDTQYRFKDGLKKWDTKTNISNMFYNADTVSSITMPSDWGNVTVASYLFNNASNLATVVLPTSWNNITTLNHFFFASGIQNVNLPTTWNKVTSVWAFFYNAPQIQSITVPATWERITNVTSFASGARNLSTFTYYGNPDSSTNSLPLNWGDSITSAIHFFYNTNNLTNIKIPESWNNVTNARNMFFNNDAMTHMILPDLWGKITDAGGMFYSASSLRHITLPKVWTNDAGTTITTTYSSNTMFGGTDFDYRAPGNDIPTQSVESPADHIFPMPAYTDDLGLDLPILCPDTTSGWTAANTDTSCSQYIDFDNTSADGIVSLIPDTFKHCESGRLTQTSTDYINWNTATASNCVFTELNIEFTSGTTSWTQPTTIYTGTSALSVKFSDVFELYNKTTGTALPFNTSTNTYSNIDVGGDTQYRFIDGLNKWDGKTTASNMFNSTTQIKSITLPEFDTITNLSFMFAENRNFDTLVLPATWGNVTVMNHMFYDSDVINVNMPQSWDSVVTMYSLFYSANRIQSLTIPASWGNITNPSRLASGATTLASISYYGNPNPGTNALPPQWDKVTTTSEMLYRTAITDITLPSSWGNVTTTQLMLSLTPITSVNLPSTWGTKLTNINRMFYGCSGLTAVVLPQTWGNVSDAGGLFHSSRNLIHITLPTSWENNAGTAITTIYGSYNMFSNTGFTSRATGIPVPPSAEMSPANYIFPNDTWQLGIGLDNLPLYCLGGTYVAANTKVCIDCGVGYYCPAGGHVFNPTTDMGRFQCTGDDETTIGYGAGADEAGDCGRILHTQKPDGTIQSVYLRSDKKTTPSLNVDVNGTVYFGNMDNDLTKGFMRMNYNNTTYSVYDDSM